MFNKITKKLRSNPHLLILALILIIALFFRTYKLVDWFEFAHDGDLYSWIVKDIVVDKHLRLIGQETSAPGIFIGPLFYYMLIPFFLLTKMDPVGAVIPITAVGILTVASYYYVFSKLFNKNVGLIAAFLYATLLSLVYFDRRVVPSTPTNLWLIWYLYSVIMLSRGNLSFLPLIGLLVGLIWHIHIALAPALVVIPFALFLSNKLPTPKQVLLSLLAFLILFVPFIVFEARHEFSQTLALTNNFNVEHGGGTGAEKFNLIIIKIGENINRLFFFPQGVPYKEHRLTVLIFFILSLVVLSKQQVLPKKEINILFFWIIGVILFYTFSSTIISEYYFANLEIVFLLFVSIFLYLLYKFSKLGKYLTLGLLSLILIKNLVYLIQTDIYHKGYKERKAVVAYIKENVWASKLGCASISYITSPGENVGFRYFFWLSKLHITQVQEDSATYTIVNPPELANGKKERQFGQIKVIPPEIIPSKERIAKSCSGQNSNLTDPLFGFTR